MIIAKGMLIIKKIYFKDIIIVIIKIRMRKEKRKSKVARENKKKIL